MAWSCTARCTRAPVQNKKRSSKIDDLATCTFWDPHFPFSAIVPVQSSPVQSRSHGCADTLHSADPLLSSLLPYSSLERFPFGRPVCWSSVVLSHADLHALHQKGNLAFLGDFTGCLSLLVTVPSLPLPKYLARYGPRTVQDFVRS